jgi:hypothetical protein
MGVITRADECREKVIQLFDEAISNLEEFVNPNTYGTSDYSNGFIERVENVLSQLRKHRRTIQW